jgi:ribonucleoside-diphosphate reductase beta chain
MASRALRNPNVAPLADPILRDYKVVGGFDTFTDRSFWPRFFSRVVARLQWNATAIDLTADARAWPELPDERRSRLMKLLAGFVVAEDAVAEQLTPFADVARNATMASHESLVAWVFFLQRRDEQRHALLFDRIAAEVLGLPGATPAERRAAAREHVAPAVLELFEERLPAVAAELAAGHTGLAEGVSLYHLLLEGVVFDAGQHALLDDLADGAMPGVREGVERVERDERWHVGFGLRCLIETEPSDDVLYDLLARAEDAAEAWGDAIPAALCKESARKVAHRLHVARLIETPVAAKPGRPSSTASRAAP